MPLKDKDAKRAYMRHWYTLNREKVIARVAERKRSAYAGVCLNCGGPTVGQSKNDRPEYCGKPACASVQRRRGLMNG